MHGEPKAWLDRLLFKRILSWVPILQVHSVQGRTALEAEYKSSPYGMRKYVGPPSVRDHQLVKFKALFFFHAKRRATSAAVGGVAAK